MTDNKDAVRPSSKVSQILDRLDGTTEHDPRALEWVEDIPAGKKLLEWIGFQVHSHESSGEQIDEGSLTHGIGACLAGISGDFATE